MSSLAANYIPTRDDVALPSFAAVLFLTPALRRGRPRPSNGDSPARIRRCAGGRRMQQRHEHRLQWWQTSEHAPGTVAPAKSQTVPEGLRRGRRRTAPPKRIRWTLRASGAPAMKRVPLRPGGRAMKYRPGWMVNEIPSTLDRYHPLDQISAAAIDPIAGPRLCSQERWPRSASPLLPLPCRATSGRLRSRRRRRPLPGHARSAARNAARPSARVKVTSSPTSAQDSGCLWLRQEQEGQVMLICRPPACMNE